MDSYILVIRCVEYEPGPPVSRRNVFECGVVVLVVVVVVVVGMKTPLPHATLLRVHHNMTYEWDDGYPTIINT